MAWVTKDQIERARQFPVLDYILRNEAGDYKRVGRGYRLRADDALAVDENCWYCHKAEKGSKTALDYLVEIKGYGLVEAVCFLLNERPQERSGNAKSTTPSKKHTPNTRPPPVTENKPKIQAISLPLRNKDNKRVIAYLQSRSIDRDSILSCIERGVLFESKYYHNAVFLGKDERGKTRFAAMRSTTAKFMCDAEGSEKKYGFVIPAENPQSNTVAVFESPIEALSHQTLCLHGHIPTFDGWRLSLSGVSTLGLNHFLEQNPDVTHCVVCTNNDDAGDKAMGRIKELEESLGITVTRSIPPHGNDWNNSLEAVKKAERNQKPFNKTRNSNSERG